MSNKYTIKDAFIKLGEFLSQFTTNGIVKKDNILNAEDAQLIKKYLIKLQKEISNEGK